MARTFLIIGLALLQLPPVASAEPNATRHWAFQSPQRPALPVIREHHWPVNPIDYFVMGQLESRSLSPAQRADRATLLRRVTLDLTGVPPTIAEMDEYTLRSSPDDYQRLVARLIESPRFGERMAVPWLDVARFADTHGFLIDAHRDMSRWRDWVIEAFNQNMPFDQFTIDQIAGDMRPGATSEQLIASGFNRNHMINYENGADPEEYRMEYVMDRAATTANVWLGLTFQCARCHDHKYDPLSLEDFYQWCAFFNNVPEKGLDGNLGNAIPVVSAPTAEQRFQLDRVELKLASVEASLKKKQLEALAKQSSWESRLSDSSAIAPPEIQPLLQAGFNALDQLVCDEHGKARFADVHGSVNLIKGKRDRAILLDGGTYVDVKDVRWPASREGLALAAWVFPTTADAMNIATLLDIRQLPRLQWGMDELQLRLRIRTGLDDAEFVTQTSVPLKRQTWQHIAMTWNGIGDGKFQWFVNGLPVVSAQSRDSVDLPSSLGGTWRIGSDGSQSGFRGMLDEVLIFASQLASTEIAGLANANPVQAALAVPANRRTSEQQHLLCDAYLRRMDPQYPALAEERDSLERERSQLRRSISTTMVMQELPDPRPAFVLRHGKFDQPGKRVDPDTPALLPPFPGQYPRNRLGLAQWLVQPSNPLTARVMVNRLWQIFFGQGLVRTPDDFGLRGEVPTHPQLLDWLAVEFMESGWDVKHIVRLIVTSATYQQSSRMERDQTELDPENRWLARAPRLRMEAEMLRDSLLFSSGLLHQRIGGPSVFPYQPPGLWEEISFDPAEFSAQTYIPSQGADLYRRGIYTFWKRTMPPPALAIFDAPTRETCVAFRSRSNTPLQALVLMNEPTAIDAARHLASRGMREAGKSAQSISAWMFRGATSRAVTTGEQRELVELFERQRLRFQKDPSAAQKLVPKISVINSLDTVDHAAWTVVANVILSLDEAITRN